MKQKTTITKRQRKVALGKPLTESEQEIGKASLVAPDDIERAKAHARQYAPLGFVARLEAVQEDSGINEKDT